MLHSREQLQGRGRRITLPWTWSARSEPQFPCRARYSPPMNLNRPDPVAPPTPIVTFAGQPHDALNEASTATERAALPLGPPTGSERRRGRLAAHPTEGISPPRCVAATSMRGAVSRLCPVSVPLTTNDVQRSQRQCTAPDLRFRRISTPADDSRQATERPVEA